MKEEIKIITVSLSEKLLKDFDAFVKLKGYSSRVEAIREAMRDLMHPRFQAVPRE